MNKTYSFYDLFTGQLLGRTFSGPEDSLEANTPEGVGAVEGVYDHNCYKLDLESNKIVYFIPNAPDDNHEWSGTRWVLKPEIAQRETDRQKIKAQILQLEQRLNRPQREWILADEGSAAEQDAAARIANFEAQITELRAQFNARYGQSL